MKLKLPAFAVDALINRAKKTPFDHLDGYMNRFWVLNPKGVLSRLVTARIHEILRGDADRHLHDHPWPYTTVILKFGYTEVTHWKTMDEGHAWIEAEVKRGGLADGTSYDKEMNRFEVHIYYGVGCVLHRPAGFAHRLIVQKGITATTLFIMGRYQNKWGFHTPEGKIYWRDYLNPDDVTKRAAIITEHYSPKKGNT